MQKNFKILITFLLLMMAREIYAQKLPNVQQVGLRAPASIKIEGKANEWGSQFQAYNKATDVFYTLSNDDKNLYLIVQATKPRVIEKIIAVGISFTINKAGKKKDDDPDNKTIVYPNIEPRDGAVIIMDAGAKANSNIKKPTINGMPIDTNDKSIIKSTDSLKNVANKLLIASSKVIKVKGIKNIPDDEISVYNEQDISTAEYFDAKSAYTYELAVPLSSLNLSIDKDNKFNYQIKIESRFTNIKKGMHVSYVYTNGIKTDVDQDLDATTDFWAEYTLAKKP